ncbi:MAG TPA: ABC transporter permease [Actinomycetes bacterium]|nr:ABC transporter permease [Actinomycetes bacterium]
MRTLRPIFWIETLLAVVSGISTVLTMLWRDWIEILFGVNPDHGNGSAEWLIVVASLAVTVVLSMLARREWRRAAAAGA